MEESPLDNFSASLRTPELQSLANYFGRTLRRARNLRWKHVELIFEEVLVNLHIGTMTEVLKDSIVKPVFAGSGKFSNDFLAEVNKRMSDADDGRPWIALARGAAE